MKQYLSRKMQRWILRGADRNAQRLPGAEGWRLTICFRARVVLTFFSLSLTIVFVTLIARQILQPEPWTWRMVVVFISAPICVPLFIYCGFLMFLYRVDLDSDRLTLYRFLLRPVHINWSEVTRIVFSPFDETLKLDARDGSRVGIYLTLNGLSAVRRCLTTFAPASLFHPDSMLANEALLQIVPAWHCSQADLEGNPFDPLSSTAFHVPE